jgi:hypothetical protein
MTELEICQKQLTTYHLQVELKDIPVLVPFLEEIPLTPICMSIRVAEDRYLFMISDNIVGKPTGIKIAWVRSEWYDYSLCLCYIEEQLNELSEIQTINETRKINL